MACRSCRHTILAIQLIPRSCQRSAGSKRQRGSRSNRQRVAGAGADRIERRTNRRVLSFQRFKFDTRRLKSLCALVVGVFSLIQAVNVHGQTTSNSQSEQNFLNWYYSSVFGTGVYTAGDQTVSVLQIPFGHELKAPSADEWGLKIVVPVSLGFYNFKFDQLLEGETPSSVGTASIFPGIEGQIPVTSNWRLKPYANAGWGWDLTNGGGALIYAAGLKSLVGLPVARSVEVSLGNQLTLAGYSPEGGSNQPLGIFVAGLNVETVT